MVFRMIGDEFFHGINENLAKFTVLGGEFKKLGDDYKVQFDVMVAQMVRFNDLGVRVFDGIKPAVIWLVIGGVLVSVAWVGSSRWSSFRGKKDGDAGKKDVDAGNPKCPKKDGDAGKKDVDAGNPKCPTCGRN